MHADQKAAGWRSYDAIDCKQAGKSLRYYKRRSHKKLRSLAKREVRNATP